MTMAAIGATRAMQAILAAEAMFYLVVVTILLRLGAALGSALLVVVLLAASGRLLIVLTTYAFAHAFRSPVPPARREGWIDLMAMAVAEYLAFVALFSFIQPFARRWMGGDRLAGVAGRLPVLLVHGYQCNRGFWIWQRYRLEKAGWSVATLDLEPAHAPIDAYAEQIARRVDAVCAATGADRLVLVGHSMGGLAARAYLREFGCDRVASFVTLGTPHYGSRLAMLGLGSNARQMLPASDWLAALNGDDEERLPERFVAAWSAYDNYVLPQDGALHPAAEACDLGAVGHLSMAFAPAVTKLLLVELAKAAAPAPT